MPNPPRLDILSQLRRQKKLSQTDAAKLCGLEGNQSYQSLGKWELGMAIPTKAQRVLFMHYLWDHLRLRDDPARIESVWEMLVDLWNWDPISDPEWSRLTHEPRPKPSNTLEQRLQQLESKLEQLPCSGRSTKHAMRTRHGWWLQSITTGTLRAIGMRGDVAFAALLAPTQVG